MPDPTNDISMDELLRRQRILQQMTAMNSSPESAMLGGGANLRAFDDTGGGTQATSTGVQQPQGVSRRGGGEGILSNLPFFKQMGQASRAIGGLGQPRFTPNPQATDVANPPTLVRNTPPNQPTPGPGQQIAIDPNTGQPTLVPRFLGSGQYVPNLGQ